MQHRAKGGEAYGQKWLSGTGEGAVLKRACNGMDLLVHHSCALGASVERAPARLGLGEELELWVLRGLAEH